MAKRALLDVLEQTIGKYVLNLEPESLNVAIWNGKIELNSLVLNVGAINEEIDRQAAIQPNLALPFRVKDGSLETITVDFPWSNLTSKPVVMTAKGLHVSVVPAAQYSRPLTRKNAEEHAARALKIRREEIDSADALRLKSRAIVDFSDERSSTFLSRLARRILENLQMQIKDVQISMETSYGAFGVGLQSLGIQTTDEHGEKAYVDRTSTPSAYLHKALEIRGCSIHVDGNTVNRHTHVRVHDNETSFGAHSYVLAPCSVDVRFRRADKGTPDEPKYQIRATLPSLVLQLSKFQIYCCMELQRLLKSQKSFRPVFPEYRPSLGFVTSENAREWWLYSVRCIWRLRGKTPWHDFLSAFRRRKEYVRAYKRVLKHSQESAKDLQWIEDNTTISVTTLMSWRELAEAEIKKEAQMQQSTDRAIPKASMVSSFFRQVQSDESNDVPVASFDELGVLNAVIDDGTEGDLDALYVDAEFTLHQMKVVVSISKLEHVAKAQLGEVSMSLSSAISGESELSFGLQNIRIVDLSTTKTVYEEVVSTLQGNEEESAFRLKLCLNRMGDRELVAKLQAHRVIVAFPFILELLKLLSGRRQPTLVANDVILTQSLSGSVNLFYDANECGRQQSYSDSSTFLQVNGGEHPFSSDVSSLLKSTWKRRQQTKSLVVDIDLRAPEVVIPTQVTDKDSSLLVLDLGRLRFRYGGHTADSRVLEWFEEHHERAERYRENCDRTHESPCTKEPLESGELLLTDFCVAISNHQAVLDGRTPEDYMLLPTSVKVVFGLHQHGDGASIFCCGTLPSISLVVAPKSLLVLRQVTLCLRGINSDVEAARTSLSRVASASDPGDGYQSHCNSQNVQLFVDASLTRFSLRLATSKFQTFDCCLAKLGVKSSWNVIGATEIYFQLGHLWITQTDVPCDGRVDAEMLVHSKLPSSVSSDAPCSTMVDALNKEDAASLVSVKLDFPGLSSGVATKIAVMFTSLTVKWNPESIKSIASEVDHVIKCFSGSGDTILPSQSDGCVLDSGNQKEGGATMLDISLSIDLFEMTLLSAIDKLPVFLIATQCLYATYQCSLDKTTISACLGGLAIDTPAGHGTRSMSHHRRLLSLSTSKKEKVLKFSYVEDVGDRVEALASLDFSPIHLTYIQSQVLALIDYATTGILGVITHELAESAAKEARRITAQRKSNLKLNIRASSLQCYIPCAAHHASAFRVFCGSIESTCVVSECQTLIEGTFLDCWVRDTSGQEMQDSPLSVALCITMPCIEQDDAIASWQCSFNIPQVAFKVSQPTYLAVLFLLSMNIGEERLFLRDIENEALSNKCGQEHLVSHAGAAEVGQGLNYTVIFTIGSMSLEILQTTDYPLAAFSVYNASFEYCVVGQHRTKSTLHVERLSCCDLRKTTVQSEHRMLVMTPPEASFFNVVHEAGPSQAVWAITIGSPEVFVIPDLTFALAEFFGSEIDDNQWTKEAIISSQLPESQEIRTDVVLSASRCHVHLLELATQSRSMKDDLVHERVSLVASFQSSVSVSHDKGNIVQGDAEFHANNVQVYTSSGKQYHAMQVLEPTSLSVYIKQVVETGSSISTSVNVATTEPLDMILSMDDIALIDAVLKHLVSSSGKQVETCSPSAEAFYPTDVEPGRFVTSKWYGTPLHSQRYALNFTVPTLQLMLINDLQGMDEPLLKVSTINLVANGHLRRLKKLNAPVFALNCNLSVTSDLYDDFSRNWIPLLSFPWELNLKATRTGPDDTIRTRNATSVDFECFPCKFNLSKGFIAKVAATKHVWQLYSDAVANAPRLQPEHHKSQSSIATSATRRFLPSLPYGVENLTGVTVAFQVQGWNESPVQKCESGFVTFFRFSPPPARGIGGKRQYGQDTEHSRDLVLTVEGTGILLESVDTLLDSTPRCFRVGEDVPICLLVVKEANTTIIRVFSGIEIRNLTCVAFDVSLVPKAHDALPVGSCSVQKSSHPFVSMKDSGRKSSNFALPSLALKTVTSRDVKHESLELRLVFSPTKTLSGSLKISFASRQRHSMVQPIECRPHDSNSSGKTPSFCMLASCRFELVDGKAPFVSISLEPRARIMNYLPVSIKVKSPMPHLVVVGNNEPGEVFTLNSGSFVEVFTPGPSIAVNFSPSHQPVAGCPNSWLTQGWINLSLGDQWQPEVTKCEFSCSNLAKLGELLVTRQVNKFQNARDVAAGSSLSFVIRSSTVLVDHVGELLASAEVADRSTPTIKAAFGLFPSSQHSHRISFLPDQSIPITLLHLTIDGQDGICCAAPFRPEEVPLNYGGLDTYTIKWRNSTASGLYAYRCLVDEASVELHVIPAFIIFNSSRSERLLIRHSGDLKMFVEPGSSAPLRAPGAKVVFAIECTSYDGKTAALRVEDLGVTTACIRSGTGIEVGTLTVQTVAGGRDSRFVIHLGEINKESHHLRQRAELHWLQSDAIRFRVQMSELKVSIFDGPNCLSRTDCQKEGMISADERVCSFVLHRVTMDWQRVFKDSNEYDSPERSQLSFMVQRLSLYDYLKDSRYPVVFDSAVSANAVDLCVRIRGPFDTDLLQLDLIDLRLAYCNKKQSHFEVGTSEGFVWKLLDLADSIFAATGYKSGVDILLEWVEEQNDFVARAKDASYQTISHHVPPKLVVNAALMDIKRLRISPLALKLSFERDPQADRYREHKGKRGAALLNYFSRKLKFQVDDAELKFDAYEARNIQGNFHSLLKLVSSTYQKRLRMKLVSILPAVTYQDWKYIAAREDGDDSFSEGDILRSAGNLTGKTGSFVLRKTGQGLGKGVRLATGAVGDGIESASAAIGARAVGTGVNHVVSGSGDAVAHVVTGVGVGAGQALKGASKGVGQMFGGVSGGVLKIGSGIGKGVVQRDGKMIVTGLSDGVSSLGTGVGQGVESVVTGTVEGVASVGKGLFSGIKSAGKGIGGAFSGKRLQREKKN